MPVIDPTPGPGDVTSFEQVKGGPPAVALGRPAPKEVPLSAPSDPNKPLQFSKSTLEDFDALEKIDDQGTPKAKVVKPEAAKPTEAEKTAAAAKTEPADPAEPSEPTAEDDPALESQVQGFKTLKEIRTAHKELLKRERAWKKEQAELQGKWTEAETRLKSFDPEAFKATSAELEAARKRAEELESQVRTLDYTKSTEFHEKYVKPVAKVLETAYQDLTEMTVTNPDGTVRQATKEDFQALLAMPIQAASAKAKEMFGDAAQEVLAHRRAFIALKREERSALENASKLAEETRQRQVAEQAQHTEKFQTLYKQESQKVAEQFPDLFKEKPGDVKGNEFLQKGWAVVKALEKPDLAPEERIKLAVVAQQRAAAFPRVLYVLDQTRKQLDEALAKLKSYEASAPRETDGGNGTASAPPGDVMERAMKGLETLPRMV